MTSIVAIGKSKYDINQLDEFIDYVFSFYGADDALYQMNVTKGDITLATEDYLQVISDLDNDRFTYANCDAYDFDNVEEVKSLFPDGFDIVFDDGPHTLDSQKKCIEYYLPLLRDGGTMFIEDVQKIEDFEDLKECFDEVKETLEGKYTFDKVDLRYVKDRYDDLIFAIKRVDS